MVSKMNYFIFVPAKFSSVRWLSFSVVGCCMLEILSYMLYIFASDRLDCYCDTSTTNDNEGVGGGSHIRSFRVITSSFRSS
jgi:hypothetical protein